MQFDNQVIGKTIRLLRTQKGMSQELLSGLAGIARTHLTMIENGKKQPNLNTVWKLASALEINPSELVHAIEVNAFATIKEEQSKKRGQL